MTNDPTPIESLRKKEDAARREKYLSDEMVHILKDLLWSIRTPALEK